MDFGAVAFGSAKKMTFIVRNMCNLALDLFAELDGAGFELSGKEFENDEIALLEDYASQGKCFQLFFPRQALGIGEEMQVHVIYRPCRPEEDEDDEDDYDDVNSDYEHAYGEQDSRASSRASTKRRKRAPKPRMVDRAHMSILQKAWGPVLGKIRCLGVGGRMSISFSRQEIDLGNVPKDTGRAIDVQVINDGDVPVTLGISARDEITETISRSCSHEIGVLSIRAPHPFVVHQGQTTFFTVKFRAKESGDIDYGFKLNVIGSAVDVYGRAQEPKYFQFRVKGTGDFIELSDAVKVAVQGEHFPYTVAEETFPNYHLHQVLLPVDHVPAVSVHHLITPVRPLVRPLPSIADSLAIPPPLTNQVLRTFKKWYHNRATMRMTGDKFEDKWANLEKMLKS